MALTRLTLSHLVVLAALLLPACLSLSSSSTLTTADRERLRKVLEPGWQLKDLSLVMYAASGYKHLGLQVPDAKAACSFVSGFTSSGSPNTETIFQAASAAQYLGCPIAVTPALKQTLSSSINDGSSPVELYHAALALKKLGVTPDSAKLLAATQAALKRDDSVLNLGYAFHIGSVVSGDVSSLFSRIEDAVVQADEVDGRMLQFEGGLSITALVVDGAYQLCEAAKRPVPVRPEQAVKFANYLLSRKSVQLPKGVHYLLNALTMFTTNKYHLPVSVSLASSVAVSESQPKVQVSVTDLLGQAVAGGVSVAADSVTRETDGTKLASNVALKAVKESKTLFELEPLTLKPGRGFYLLSVTATGADKRLVGNVAAQLRFKVLTAVSVEKVELGTADSDQSAAPALKSIPYGTKLKGAPLEADRHQKVVLRFMVKETASGSATTLHQAFVRVTHQASNREIIFVAEPDNTKLYKFDMVVAASQAEFKGVSGVYSLELILGDATISNPIRWHLADLALTFPTKAQAPADQDVDYTYKAKPSIAHVFQSPEPRPSTFVSTSFTVLCFMPLLILIGLWAKLGVNVSNFPLSLTAIGFHLGIGGIFAVFCLFWLQLNMFTTLRYLFMVGVVTFYCGNSMLSKIATARKENAK